MRKLTDETLIKQTDKNEKKGSGITQIFDKLLKKILTLSSTAVINLINGLYKRNFPTDSKLTYNWTENIKDNLERTIADAIITVNDTNRFHIEAQINNDKLIALRMFDYGFQDAMKYKIIEDDMIILDLPQPKVIYLEHTSSTPNTAILRLRIENEDYEDCYEYKIPSMKFLDCSIDDLNKQHMVILLPLYLLKLRKEINKGATKEHVAKLKDLISNGIVRTIKENEAAGNINMDDTAKLVEYLDKLYSYLYGDIELFKEEGMDEFMSDIMVFEVERALNEKNFEVERMLYEKNLEVERALNEKNSEIERALNEKNSEIDRVIHERDKMISEREEKAKLEIARNMLGLGMTAEQIRSVTNLPLNTIEELQNQKLN